VRAEVVADDRDPRLRWAGGAQVAAEFQEPGPVLARLDSGARCVQALMGDVAGPPPRLPGTPPAWAGSRQKTPAHAQLARTWRTSWPPAAGWGELRRPAALIPRIQRSEPIGVEVVNHVTDPAFAGERHVGDPGHVHPRRGQQHHLHPAARSPPTAVPAHDPHQPAALVVIDLTHPHTPGHRPSLNYLGPPDQGAPWQPGTSKSRGTKMSGT
jgi:hypothetical protein